MTGKTADVNFEIGVTKTIKGDPKKIWDFLMSAKGREIWLGKSTDFRLAPKATYKTTNGATGEIRTLHRGERLRLTWQAKNWKQPSTLQVTVTPRKSTNGTCIRFHQEKLSSKKEREAMRKHWQEVLENITDGIDSL